MPIAPEPRRRSWIPERTKQPHQGRATRTDEYDTSRWRNARKHYLMLHPLCVECKANGRIAEATVLDHILRVNAGGSFWDQDNWQGLCKSCHNRKSAKERHGDLAATFRGELIIAYGPPGSGKTTWAVKQAPSILIDLDIIWQEVTGLGWYEKPERFRATVYAKRDYLINQISTLKAGQRAILISTNLTPYKIQEAIRLYKPTIEEFRVSKQTCIERIETDERRKDKQRHIDLINEWFEANKGWE